MGITPSFWNDKSVLPFFNYEKELLNSLKNRNKNYDCIFCLASIFKTDTICSGKQKLKQTKSKSFRSPLFLTLRKENKKKSHQKKEQYCDVLLGEYLSIYSK